MTLTIQDTKNDDTEVTTWNGAVLVVDFKVKRSSSYDQIPYFGFDWIKLNNKGEITQLHDINISKCTHVYEGGNSYTASNDTKTREVLKTEFKTFFAKSGSTKKYSSQAWIFLPGINQYIENLTMKLEGTYQGVGLSFDIPSGIILEYQDGTNFIKIQDNTPVIFTNKECQIRIKATREIDKVEVNVKNPDGDIIGSLGVYAYEQKSIKVYLWAVVENPGGKKSPTDLANAKNAIMYTAKEQEDLKKKLDRVFMQVGINLQLEEAGTITYDPSDESYSGLVLNKFICTRENGNDFFKTIKNNNKILLDAMSGINLMIVDAKCEYPDTTSDGKPATGNLGGLGDVGIPRCIVFNQARTDYGICSHEIGHTLGLMHSFYDIPDSDKHIQDKLDIITNLTPKLINNMNHDDIIYIDKRLAEEKAVEKLLFKKSQTTDLMDYGSSFDYLLKWQWDIIYATVEGRNYKLNPKISI